MKFNLVSNSDLDYINRNHFNDTSTLEEVEEAIDTGNITGDACKVLLFNDEWHSFDEVINQIKKAIKCSTQHAENLTVEVHERGKAIVYSGDLSDCLRVSGILEEISLHTQIEM